MTFDPFLLIGVAAFIALILWFVLRCKQETPEQPAQTQRSAPQATNTSVFGEVAEPASFFSALARSRSQLSSSLKNSSENISYLAKLPITKLSPRPS